jgi:hypothetical protein
MLVALSNPYGTVDLTTGLRGRPVVPQPFDAGIELKSTVRFQSTDGFQKSPDVSSHRFRAQLKPPWQV